MLSGRTKVIIFLGIICALFAFLIGRATAKIEIGDFSAASAYVKAAEKAIESKNFSGAHDYYMAALHKAPQDPALFRSILSAVLRAPKDQDPALRLLILDLTERLSLLVPMQPVGDIENARKEVEKLAAALEESVAVPVDDLIEGEPPIVQPLAELLSTDVPTEVLLLGIERQRDSLRQRAVVGLTTKVEALYWKEYKDELSQLDQSEHSILATRVYPVLSEKCKIFRERAEPEIDKTDKSMKDNWDELTIMIEECQGMALEIEPFDDAGIPEASQDMKDIKQILEALVDTRSWRYNQYTLHKLREIEKYPDPFMRAQGLTEVNRDRLMEYLLEKWNASWRNAFQECEPQQQLELLKMLYVGKQRE